MTDAKLLSYISTFSSLERFQRANISLASNASVGKVVQLEKKNDTEFYNRSIRNPKRLLFRCLRSFTLQKKGEAWEQVQYII